ncbi:MAG: hypothetical protein SPK06_00225 [Kiritimatiellia bacterium]|nr:hypothetical protein [Kiritimatiellia bacterium]
MSGILLPVETVVAESKIERSVVDGRCRLIWKDAAGQEQSR